ncbi:MAG TPA: asparagine synthase-related protein, partial [Thermoplasmata archaeon]|nr:asparagine synthase-related protein [Thermoplasmata archaeon]
RLVYHLDEPKVGPGAIPQYFVASLAAKHVRVVLTGHGGDELFAGYPPYLTAYLADTAKRGGGVEVLRAAKNLPRRVRSEGVKRTLLLPAYSLAEGDLRRYGRAAFFSDKEAASLLGKPLAARAKGHDPRTALEAARKRPRTKSFLNRLLYLDVKTYLPSLLEVEDRMSMAVSLEGRVPILDHRLAEFAGSLPAALKVRGMTLKYLPRKALAGMLPKDVIDHKKMGFPVPIATWFRGPLRGWVERQLDEAAVAAAGVLDPTAVRSKLDAQMRGRGNAERLWMLLNVQRWAVTFLGDQVRRP